MNTTTDRIAVLGGGISGITTALTLKLLGTPVRLIAAELAGDRDVAETSARFATPYAAASVLPHSVESDHLNDWFGGSQAVFGLLSERAAPPVRTQDHLEIFEREPDRPAYLTHLDRVGTFGPVAPGTRLDDTSGLPDRSAEEAAAEEGVGEEAAAEETVGEEAVGREAGDFDAARTLTVPGRPEVEALYGWRCRIHFAEQPRYLRYLRSLLERLAIPVERRTLDRKAVAELDEPVFVDCLGASAPRIFEDPAPMRYLRGLLVHAAPPARSRPQTRSHERATAMSEAGEEALSSGSEATEPVSYNYVPDERAPAGFDRPRDLYFYPRSDRWILGGTRQVGPVKAVDPEAEPSETDWTGETYEGPTVRIDGREVPEAIVGINRSLIRQLTGADLVLDGARVHEGYRFLREPVRLEREPFEGGTLVHNYGHGGAGVTLSWGCALAVAELIYERDVPPEELGNALEPIL